MAPKSAIKYAIVAAMLISAVWAIASPSVAIAATGDNKKTNDSSSNNGSSGTQDSKLHLPKPTDGVPSCGSVVTEDVTLQSDLKCDKNGLTVGADGITINLNGHTIESGKSRDNAMDAHINFGGDSGISVPNANHVTILGPGTIKGYENGVAFIGSSKGKVSDLILENNRAGVSIQGSNNIEVSINTINHNKYAIVSDSSSENKEVFNSVAGNEKDGIVLLNTDDSVIAANNMFGNGDNGIVLDSQSSGNKVDYNNVFGHDKADINNANGLAPNVNNNDYGQNNNCLKSTPDGLCR
jgi:parallel beta-helix repeat protein